MTYGWFRTKFLVLTFALIYRILSFNRVEQIFRCSFLLNKTANQICLANKLGIFGATENLVFQSLLALLA